MHKINHKRRRMLLNISQLALVSGLAASCPAGQSLAASLSKETDLELLACVAYDLFPYEELPAELYVRIAETLLATDDPILHQGLAQLRSTLGNQTWQEVEENQRLDILQTMENSAVFALIRTTSISVLYRSEAVFNMLGYGGSAVEHGGYINRGFDEIHWLPER